jgi:hypothetical protein
MRYALLIYGNEADDAKMTPAEQEAQMGQYYAYTQELNTANAARGGEALLPSTMSTTVRVNNGKVLATDGPFAETKEQLAGFYLIEVENLDQAIAWAAKIPHAHTGSIEVRPVMEMN